MGKNLLHRVFPAVVILFAAFLGGCGKKTGDTEEAAAAAKVVVISPHNENIREEFDNAFHDWHQQKYGTGARIEYRDVGGGSNAILRFLRNVYSRSETSGIDVVFGGGEYTFQKLTEQGLLTRLELPAETMEQIPAHFSGMEMYDPQMYWIGNVVSSFGFIYNKQILDTVGIKPPQKWADLGGKEFFDLLMLADPSQSGSIAAAYEMIVQSEETWPQGWAKLLSILSNAKQFTDSSGAAADAPVIGLAPVATCIDFYGTMRVSKAPEKLGYISPKGETGFTPDPIGILKNPPNAETAKRFVEFVMSLRGQALWALPPGHEMGPKRSFLNRPPIRKDFYELYGNAIPKWVPLPYEEGSEMRVDAELRAVRFDVLVQLVRAAAVDNRDAMKKAKQALIASGFDPQLMKEFTRLPDNVDTVEDIRAIHEALNDKAQAERIVTEWISYFRDQYRQITQ